jgi:tRNA A-37 threonylcarbamoyl transferase component Bud32
MPLWAGHEFTNEDLEFWTQEIFGAAIDVPVGDRDRFLQVACEGSDDLHRRVSSLLESALDTASDQPLHQTCTPGDVVRDCLILCCIGKGGTAEVYKAIQRPLRRLVAVKVIKRVRDEERTALAREAAITSRLNHEHIIKVYDADFEGEKPCVVMEYVDGISLREWLRREKDANRLPPSRAVLKSIAQQIVDALRKAHSHKLIHRDIKPENILLSASDGFVRVKVADFGLARRSSGPQGVAAGTPGYISPEQLQGGVPDQRADIFSLGVVLYEILTGEHPYCGETDLETYHNTLHRQPALIGSKTLGEYENVIRKALAKDPVDRYGSVQDLFADLGASESAPNSEPHGNPFLSEFPAPMRKWMERHSTGFAVASASFLWGCISMALSIMAGAACMKVIWQPVGGAASFEMVYGYAVELNAGLWYIFGASLSLLGGFGLLHAAFTGLAGTATLSTFGTFEGISPLERIAAVNRRWFTYIVPLVIISAVFGVLVPEVVFREKNAFGWVQADLAGHYINAYYDRLLRDGTIGELPAVRQLCPKCPIRIVSVRNHSGRYDRPQPALFYLLRVSALTHQIVFSASAAYIGFKVLFFFGILSSALLGNEKLGVRLTPDLRDRSDQRFGLGRLDNVYYAILILVALTSAVGLMQVTANLNKGTYFLTGREVLPLIGQPMVLLSAAVLLAAVVIVPFVLFMLLAIKVVNQELARLNALEKQLDAAWERTQMSAERERIENEMKALEDRRKVIAVQALLPTKKHFFQLLLAINLILLILPPVVMTTRAGTDAGRFIREFICVLCGNSNSPQ